MQEQAIAWRHAGADIGVVPTMGALHAGHDSLVSRARRENQRVIVSYTRAGASTQTQLTLAGQHPTCA